MDNRLWRKVAAIINFQLSSRLAFRLDEFPTYWIISLWDNNFSHRRHIIFVGRGKDGVIIFNFEFIEGNGFRFNDELVCFIPNDTLKWQIILEQSTVAFQRREF